MTDQRVRQERVAPQDWNEAIEAARREGYAFFDWLSAVDESSAREQPGFDVLCHLIDVRGPASGRELRRLLLITRVTEGQPIRSITALFPGAAWHERETAEMFGLQFDGFDDGSGLGLRPLLLPEGFEGHPLRKDFVLAARASKPWPGAKEPGEGEGSSARRSPSRRRLLPPGVPDPSWGPRGDTPTPETGESADR